MEWKWKQVVGARLEAAQKSISIALVRAFLAPEGPLADQQVELAADRLGDFLAAQSRPEAALPLRALLLGVHAYVSARFRKRPEDLTKSELDALLRSLCDYEPGRVAELLGRALTTLPVELPSPRALVRALREMLVAAYYSHPSTDDSTGYEAIWKRPEIQTLAPEIAPPADRLPVFELLAKQREGRDRAHHDLFAYDGRPRVAVIGSGAGGSVVAERLSRSFDVAVFEAGPGFTPKEYPLDTLSGMALMFKDGLMTFTRNHHVHMLIPRLVGGGTVLTSGMSIRTRKRTLEAWQQSGIDLAAMRAGLDAVEKRLRLAPINEELLSDLGHLWRGPEGSVHDDLIFEAPMTNTATHAYQHAKHPSSERVKVGERCLACGLCNYGCRFGHKLSADLTYLPDARAHGARVHPNLPVARLIAERDPRSGQVRVTRIVLEGRDERPVEVDYVVLAAGAVGTPALLLRSMKSDQALAGLPSAALVGKSFGFNYGTSAVADWGTVPRRPGDMGVQIHYVASKPSDERYVLENAFMPPALLSSVVPGVGPLHREWMKRYRQLGMAVTTIGSPQSGTVDAQGQVSFAISAAEMEVIHESLAVLVRSQLRSGAVQVGLGGLRGVDERAATFLAADDHSLSAIRERIERVAPSPTQLMLMSAHPQGGMRLDRDPARGAVGADFAVHGTSNLMVADASLFPTTITINPQWTVMALASVAANAIHERIAGRFSKPPQLVLAQAASAA